MTVKRHIQLHTGSVPAGTSYIALPVVHSYSKGVLQLRLNDKATDGNATFTLLEHAEEEDVDKGFLVARSEASPYFDRHEWRLETSLPSLHYSIEVYNEVGTADVDVYITLSD